MEPEVIVTLTGKISDFSRVDNVYTTLRREGAKLLKNWDLKIHVEFQESEKGTTV